MAYPFPFPPRFAFSGPCRQGRGQDVEVPFGRSRTRLRSCAPWQYEAPSTTATDAPAAVAPATTTAHASTRGEV